MDVDHGTTGVTEEAHILVIEEPVPEPDVYALNILIAMNRMGKHVYEGTVSDKVKTARRKAGRVAKNQRRFNRNR